MHQLDHYNSKNSIHSLNIVLIAENIRTPENVGMIMRLSEAFGVEKIYFVGDHAVELTTKVKRASRNTYKTMDYEFGLNGIKVLESLISSGYHSVALEITDRSKPIQNFQSEEYKKMVLIVGSERQGISEDMLQISQSHYHIPMYGKNSSINVVNALSIGLFKLTEKC